LAFGGFFLLLGAVEGEPVGFNALAGNAAAFEQPRLNIRLHGQRPFTVLCASGQGVEHGLTPGDVGLVNAGQVA
jgi:hypothetical protein